MYRPIVVTLVLALAAVIATGCGGGDSSLTTAEYIEQADAVCKKADKKKQAKIEAFLQENTPAAEKNLNLEEEVKFASGVSEAVIPTLRTEADELKDIDSPNNEKDKADADAIIEEFDQEIEKLEDNPAAFAAKSDPFAKVAEMARKYGFKTCLIYY
jgi:hypothetical protein